MTCSGLVTAWLAAAPEPSGTGAAVWILAALLLAAAVTILIFQVMIVRQIGVLHLRMGPEVRKEPAPTRTRIKAVLMDNGAVRRFDQHATTACLLVSSTCDACEALLAELSASQRFTGWIVGLAGGPASASDVRQRFGLPEGLLFDGQELARDLRAQSVPLFILLDSTGSVVHRAVDTSLKSIEKKYLNAPVPKTLEPVPRGAEEAL